MVRRSDFSVFRSDHAISNAGAFRLPAQGHDPEKWNPVFGKDDAQTEKSVQQQSGDWAMTGKVPVARIEGLELLPAPIGRMKTIQHTKTMAGSPDADLSMRSASRNLAHGFFVPGFYAFREPMKEDRNVQNSFSRNRLGWPSPQA
jgi:hypothetical protein